MIRDFTSAAAAVPTNDAVVEAKERFGERIADLRVKWFHHSVVITPLHSFSILFRGMEFARYIQDFTCIETVKSELVCCSKGQAYIVSTRGCEQG